MDLRSSALEIRAWIQLFEDECQYIDVETDQFADVLRSVLEGHLTKWYQVKKKAIGSGTWSVWKREFMTVYGTKT